MSQKTNIAWCDSTVNDWEGCAKVSPGCGNCYAEDRDRRMMIEKVSHWGPGAPRRKSKSATRQRAALNRKPWVCDGCGEGWSTCDLIGAFWRCPNCYSTPFHRRRIFSLSLGDWLDPEVPIEWLVEMLESIRLADQCVHILCSKRPEHWRGRMIYARSASLDAAAHDTPVSRWICDWIDGKAPPNIWILTSVEDQRRADERIPHLMQIPAVVRGLSCEPLLEPIHLGLTTPAYVASMPSNPNTQHLIDWIIVGGESGPKARPCSVRWIKHIRHQGKAAGVPVFVKQVGSNPQDITAMGHPKGADPSEWPMDLRVREYPK